MGRGELGGPGKVRGSCRGRYHTGASAAPSLAWLLPVHQEFDRPKDELWQRHGPKWMSVLTGVLGTTQSFRLSYRHLVATDSAIIAVADEPNSISALRRELLPVLPVPAGLSAGKLVHMTLFRYARPFATRHRWCGGSRAPSLTSMWT